MTSDENIDIAEFTATVRRFVTDTRRLRPAHELAIRFGVSIMTVSRWAAGANAPATPMRSLVVRYIQRCTQDQ